MEEALTYQALKQRDPSRTTALRNAFSRELRKRFRELRALILKVVVEEDAFALFDNGTKVTVMVRTPGRRRFAFRHSAEKVNGFMKWLQEQVDDGILQVSDIENIGQEDLGAWTNRYIKDSYKRGVARAQAQMRAAGKVIPAGMPAGFYPPLHIDRLGLLYTRAYTELKGITDDMGKMISKVLAKGLAEGLGPREIAKRLNQVISGAGGDLGLTDVLGRFVPAEVRADMLARTEIIRAHAEAQLQEFENWGVQGVNIKAEFITAGDHRVCPICERYNKTTFTLAEARGLIPLHPRCRCVWIPFIQQPSTK